MKVKHPVLAVLAFSASLLVLGGSTQAHASVVDYVYVEANEGSSAGGHVALRIDDRVFDFQNAELGTLRRRRTHWDDFRYVYSVRENRTIHLARFELSPATRDALLDDFNRRYLIQNKYFSVWESLRRDRELIDWLIARAEAASEGDGLPAAHSVRGAGLFRPGTETTTNGSSGLVALHERIRVEYGADYLAVRIRALEREVEALVPRTELPAIFQVTDEEHPSSEYRFSDRYRDLCEKIFALRVLQSASALHPEARILPIGRRYALDDMEREQIRAFANDQEARLAELVDSGRPDWGFALIVGMARLQNLRESQLSGRLQFLDAFKEDVPVLSEASVQRADPFVVELAMRARIEFDVARAGFFAEASPSEAQFAWLEEMANRDADFQRGFATGQEVRTQAGRMLPERSSPVESLPVPAAPMARLQAAGRAAEEHLRRYEAALHDAFGYGLLDRNCVTQILASLEGAIHDDGAHQTGALDFIPFISYRSMLKASAGAQRLEVPSYRRTRLEAMYAVENDVAVWLRESNTLSSTIYRPNERGSFFLFFTEGAAPVRPILGAINFSAAAGQLVFGLLKAPFDRGRTVWSALKGVAFSVPELFFIDLRKGVLDYAPSQPPRTAARPRQLAGSNAEYSQSTASLPDRWSDHHTGDGTRVEQPD